MKQKLIFSLFLAATFIAGSLFAQPRFKRGAPPAGKEKMMAELSEEQQAKIQALRLQLEKDALPLKAKREVLNADLKAEMTAEQFDEAKVKNIVEQIHANQTKMQMLHLKNQRAVRDLLTPEQRQKFDLHILAGDGGRHGKRSPRAGKMMCHRMHRQHGGDAPAPDADRER